MLQSQLWRIIGATIALPILSLPWVLSAEAQQAPELPRPSPLARVEQRVGVTDFAVEYSSPGVKEREIWGELVPYGELWRTGANQSTKITASTDFTFAGTSVPAGEYSLFTIPGQESWVVILNEESELSGTRGYDDDDDVVRIKVTPASAPKRERMTFVFSDTTNDSTRLDLEWDELRVSIPIEVDTDEFVSENIEDALDEAWRPHFASGRWIFDNDGDLDEAVGYMNTSIAIQPTWWNQWYKARILAEQGKTADAIAAAEKAQALGKGDDVFEGFFQENIAKTVAGWKQD